jgi:acyl-CoA thioesterase-1
MYALLYLVGSGAAFFPGSALLLAGILISSMKFRSSGILARTCAWIGAVLIAISSTPLSWLWYAAATVVGLLWLWTTFTRARPKPGWTLGARAALAAILILGLSLEIGWQTIPVIQSRGTLPIYVIGDSISAGLTSHDNDNWPALLRENHSIDVINLAAPGATAQAALQQVQRVPAGKSVVLVEIGGNDLLNGTPVSEFESHLDALLSALAHVDREILMFELPLPPFGNRFGRVQRNLASAHHVALIPKREIMRVLADEKGTMDSIHLSPSGADAMAERVWQIVSPAYEESR